VGTDLVNGTRANLQDLSGLIAMALELVDNRHYNAQLRGWYNILASGHPPLYLLLEPTDRRSDLTSQWWWRRGHSGCWAWSQTSANGSGQWVGLLQQYATEANRLVAGRSVALLQNCVHFFLDWKARSRLAMTTKVKAQYLQLKLLLQCTFISCLQLSQARVLLNHSSL
jgi:hypothetical protein